MSGRLRSLIYMIRASLTRPAIEPKKIFVMTFDNSYSCNPASIADSILDSDPDADIVWAVSGRTDKSLFPPQIRTVNRGSRDMFREMRSAHIWLDNGLNCVWYFMPKRKGQIYINTWHGSLGIKRLGGNFAWRRRAATCRRKTDYMITNSRFEEDVFASTYWKGVPCKRFGHARNAVLFDEERFPEINTKVRKTLGIYDGRKILLYAPTFRDDGNKYPRPDPDEVTAALTERFGGDWVIVSRAHMKDKAAAGEAADNVIDASSYPNMAELMIASDAAITDYSSWIFDYLHLRRPAFIYAPDAGEYETARGFYYPLSETPFAVSSDTAGLCSDIRAHDEARYTEAVSRFLDDKECCDDIDAAKRTAEFILDMCNNIV